MDLTAAVYYIWVTSYPIASKGVGLFIRVREKCFFGAHRRKGQCMYGTMRLSSTFACAFHGSALRGLGKGKMGGKSNIFYEDMITAFAKSVDFISSRAG